jgi:hypothetical protein
MSAVFLFDRERDSVLKLVGDVQHYITHGDKSLTFEEASALIELRAAIRRAYARKRDQAKRLL